MQSTSDIDKNAGPHPSVASLYPRARRGIRLTSNFRKPLPLSLISRLGPLVERLAVLRENPALFDHMRRDDPRAAGDRVDDATAALARAQLNGGLLHTALQDAHTALTRLGVRDTSPADTDV